MRLWFALMLVLAGLLLAANTALTPRATPLLIDEHGSGQWEAIDEPDQLQPEPAQVAMGELMMCRPVIVDPAQRPKVITRT